MNRAGQGGPAGDTVYVTLTGLPLLFQFEWPFHRSGAGADFWVLHGDIRLGNSDGLHAQVAVNVSSTAHQVLRSLEPEDAEGPVINSLRKETDRKQLEFTRSSKLVPVHFSSRYYDFKRRRWVFERAEGRDLTRFIERKVFWQKQLVGQNAWLADPSEALYLGTTPAQLLAAAGGVAESGLITLEGEWAAANRPLLERSEEFDLEMKTALAALEKKHAFEDGRKTQA